jgi:hypothetical protein
MEKVTADLSTSLPTPASFACRGPRLRFGRDDKEGVIIDEAFAALLQAQPEKQIPFGNDRKKSNRKWEEGIPRRLWEIVLHRATPQAPHQSHNLATSA